MEVLGCLSQGLSVTPDAVGFNMIEVGPQRPLQLTLVIPLTPYVTLYHV